MNSEDQTKHIHYSYVDIFGEINKNKTESNIPKTKLFKPFHWNNKFNAHNHPEYGEFSCASKNGRVSIKKTLFGAKKDLYENQQPKRIRAKERTVRLLGYGHNECVLNQVFTRIHISSERRNISWIEVEITLFKTKFWSLFSYAQSLSLIPSQKEKEHTASHSKSLWNCAHRTHLLGSNRIV